MRAVLVELGRVVRPLFYCPGLKGSTSTALLVSPPSSETCGGSMAAVVGARGDGGGGGSDGRSVDGGATLSSSLCAETIVGAWEVRLEKNMERVRAMLGILRHRWFVVHRHEITTKTPHR